MDGWESGRIRLPYKKELPLVQIQHHLPNLLYPKTGGPDLLPYSRTKISKVLIVGIRNRHKIFGK